MMYANRPQSPARTSSAEKPFIASYDLGYEYSQQHYIAVQCMVEDADEDATFAHVLPIAEEAAA